MSPPSPRRLDRFARQLQALDDGTLYTRVPAVLRRWLTQRFYDRTAPWYGAIEQRRRERQRNDAALRRTTVEPARTSASTAKADVALRRPA